MFKNNKSLLVVALVVIVNALGYGIIIPVLYPYSLKFGLSDFENGLLFSVFSVFQFISTPLIGRLSDKYGRRPLLVVSIFGSAASFFLMAFAPSAFFLFLARALDGITAGNLPVAQAVISDSTSEKDRAKGFGIIGAAFGFGFVFGPAVSAFTVGISPSLPFIIAGVVSLISTLITAIFLPETNKHIGEVKKGKLFDFGKMAESVLDVNIGPALLITFFYTLAFAVFIYSFNPFAVKVYLLDAKTISILFSVIGVIGLVVQAFLLGTITKMFGMARVFRLSLILFSLMLIGLGVFNYLWVFMILSVAIALPNSFIGPLTQTILSEETDTKSQGSIMGLATSIASIGQIIGPVIGGALTTVNASSPFVIGGVFGLLCLVLSYKMLHKDHHKQSAF